MTDTTSTGTTDNKAEPTHDEKMAAKFDALAQPDTGAITAPEVTPERPAWLPEKFKSPEDMAKAYAELEKKQSAPKTAEQKPADKPTIEKPAEGAEKTEAEKAAEAAGVAPVDFKAYTDEFTKNGKLSDETYKALSDKGIDKSTVDDFIAGQEARATLYRNQVLEGVEDFAALSTWAQANVSKEDLKVYNDAVESGDIARAKQAVAIINGKYVEANGKAPKLVEGDNIKPGSDVYESRAQVTADMAKPLYKSDPAERARVAAKLARSNVF